MAKISNLPVYEGPIPIDEVQSTHNRILKKIEAIRRRVQGAAAKGANRSTSNTAVVKDSARPRVSNPAAKGANRNTPNTAVVKDGARPRVPSGENHKIHPAEAVMSGAAKTKTIGNKAVTPAPQNIHNHQRRETRSSPKKSNDIYREPIDIWDEFLARHDMRPEGAYIEDSGNAENVVELEPLEEPPPTVRNVEIAQDMVMLSGAGPVIEAPIDAKMLNPPQQAVDTGTQKNKVRAAGAGANSLSTHTDVNTEVNDGAKKASTGISMKVRLPIAVKLLALVIALLVVSLGTITALVSVLSSADVKLTAEDNNFSINRRTADALEATLLGINAAVTMLYHNFETLELSTDQNNIEKNENSISRLFFNQNPQIAAIALDGNYFINETFFKSTGGDDNMPRTWTDLSGAEFNSAAPGEPALYNATPFWGMPILVMRILVNDSTLEVFYNSETLNTLLDSGDNVSYLLNETGDVLLHADPSILRGGVNLSRIPFIKNILNGAVSNIQNLYTDDDGDEYFVAVQHLDIGSTTLITMIKKNIVLSVIIETIIRNAVLSAFILTAAIILTILFSRTISKPLRSLTGAAAKIEDGDYNLQLKAAGNDELGVLTQNFIGMGNSLENFEKFTNKAIVKLAKDGKLSRGGVNKTATVCFALIRDFREMADGLDASAVVDFVNDYLRLMVPCITSNNGCVDKFLTQGGIIIMAMWGTPETTGSSEKDALNCIRAVLSMRAALRCFNQKRRLKLGSHVPLVKLGCGINTGEVVAGTIGSDERMEYTLIGDAVNLAARIEGPNDLFDTDILISEETYKYAGRYLITKEMNSLEVKGKEKPVRVFAVINMRDPTIANSMLDDLQKNPELNIDICRQCVGPGGPRTIEEVRKKCWGGGGLHNDAALL
ncbi:MAG: HAMP domain-containing protein [Spirochaetaceae bacterium]|nr:HAMP domain-containing protein [Spirochaetaceae bacterium]